MSVRTFGGVYNRRKGALERLSLQLKSGKKLAKGKLIDLTPEDIKRIEKEIEILKSKL